MVLVRRCWLWGALLLAAMCLGCGGADNAPSGEPPDSQPAAERRADPQAVDEAIAAVERGDSTEILLQGIEITGADLRRMGRLRNVRTLDLGTQPLPIGDDDVLALADLTELTVLVLGAAPLSDRGLAAVRRLRELNRLNVVQTRITDDGLALLADLPKLELLRLGGPLITDRGMARLMGMRQLKRLILVDCPLTDESLPHLGEMTHLESLYLLGTNISEDGFANLEDTLRPHRVHLHY